MFEKIYLDRYYMKSVERIAFQEKLCKPSSGFDYESLWASRNPLRKKTLLILTLFEKLDGCQTNDEVIDRLADNGIFPPHEDTLLLRDRNPERTKEDDVSSRVISTILKISKKEILRTHLQMSPRSYYVLGAKPTFEEREKYRQYSLCDHILRTWGTQSPQDLNNLYDRCAGQSAYEFLNGEFESDVGIEKQSPLLCMFVEGIVAELSDIIEESLVEDVQIATRFARINPTVHTIQPALDDIVCISQAMLRDEIRILPNPSSLKEVMELRQRVEIRRLREVVSEWITTIQEGRIKIEPKIRRDITIANRDLRRLHSWQEYKESPIAFWINAIGGHIPLFSNFLTVVSTFGDRAFSKRTIRKSGWATLIQ